MRFPNITPLRLRVVLNLLASSIPVPESGCWLWTKQWNEDGYGRAWDAERYVQDGAHRIAYRVFRGEIPAGMRVLHKCDTPPCCNPAHLFLGTQADNILDCHKKGRRSSAGEKNGNARLTENDVRAIRASTKSPQTLSKEYGVSSHAIHAIRSYRVWKNVEAA